MTKKKKPIIQDLTGGHHPPNEHLKQTSRGVIRLEETPKLMTLEEKIAEIERKENKSKG